MKNYFVYLFLLFIFSSCSSEREEEQISFSRSLDGDEEIFVLTYFNVCDPATYFNDLMNNYLSVSAKERRMSTLEHLQGLSVEDLKNLSLLTDQVDTLIVIDWPEKDQQRPLYFYKGNKMMVPIIRFIPASGDYSHDTLCLGSKNKLNAWWLTTIE